MFEYEVKLKLNPEAFYKLLETFSRSQTVKEIYEKDTYFDINDGRCRIREADEDKYLEKTFNVKKRLEDTQIKSSEELEVKLGTDANTYQLKKALELLGFKRIGTVSKHRSQFNKFGMTINFDIVELIRDDNERTKNSQYFVEIEKVLDKQDKNVEDEILEIVDFLRIPRDCVVKNSYSDLLMQRYI